MAKLTFEDAVDEVVKRDPRFHRDAYGVLRDALDGTMRDILKREEEERHVSGEELLEGFRSHVLEEYGPMAFAVLQDWGLRASGDVGVMVFNLIEAGVFGKSDDDSPEDFVGVFDFEEAFLAPFRPEPKAEKEPPADRDTGSAAPTGMGGTKASGEIDPA